MSSFYKRLIAQKLARCLSRTKASDWKSSEKELLTITQVRKGNFHASGSQFVIDAFKLQQLAKCSVSNISLFNDGGGCELSVDGKWISAKVDQGQFTKGVLDNIRASGPKYGSSDSKCDVAKNICVEYSSPNVAKPFHVGHLRSTIIGNVLANLYEAAGHNIYRVNFLGDWGTQFGLLSLGLVRYADLDQLKADPLLELFNIYVKINQEVKSECGKDSEMNSPTYQEGMSLFTRLEQGDAGMLALWKMVNEMSVTELNKIYKRLGVHFTHVMAESSYQKQVEIVLNKLTEAGLVQYCEDGVGYVPMQGEKDIGRASVVKSDGSSLYLTRDIASALDRQNEFTLDKMHYVVDQGQRGHFIKLAHVLQQLGVPWASRPIDDIHVRFGRVMGMSTRRGNVVFLRDVLDEARTRVIESMTSRSTTRVTGDLDEVGDALGVTCIVLQDLKSNRTSDYTFSWDRALSMKADSGIFVQYCHARLCSMISGCGITLADDVDIAAIQNDVKIQNLVLHLARYPDVFSEALENLAPHCLVQYLFRLCHLVNNAYASCPVKDQNTDLAQARLLVFDCSRQVIVNCMHLLGLKPLEKI